MVRISILFILVLSSHIMHTMQANNVRPWRTTHGRVGAIEALKRKKQFNDRLTDREIALRWYVIFKHVTWNTHSQLRITDARLRDQMIACLRARGIISDGLSDQQIFNRCMEVSGVREEVLPEDFNVEADDALRAGEADDLSVVSSDGTRDGDADGQHAPEDGVNTAMDQRALLPDEELALLLGAGRSRVGADQPGAVVNVAMRGSLTEHAKQVVQSRKGGVVIGALSLVAAIWASRKVQGIFAAKQAPEPHCWQDWIDVLEKTLTDKQRAEGMTQLLISVMLINAPETIKQSEFFEAMTDDQKVILEQAIDLHTSN